MDFQTSLLEMDDKITTKPSQLGLVVIWLDDISVAIPANSLGMVCPSQHNDSVQNQWRLTNQMAPHAWFKYYEKLVFMKHVRLVWMNCLSDPVKQMTCWEEETWMLILVVYRAGECMVCFKLALSLPFSLCVCVHAHPQKALLIYRLIPNN